MSIIINDENIGFDGYIDTWIFYRYIEYIGDISIFINYSKFKDIFILYIKIILKVYEMIISIRFEKKKFLFL